MTKEMFQRLEKTRKGAKTSERSIVKFEFDCDECPVRTVDTIKFYNGHCA